MKDSVQLFNYFRSSASYRVRIALHYKGIDFDYRPVHLLKSGGEQFSGTYRELNPVSEVPTLVHGSFVLAQSLPIIQYLEEAFSGPKLLPAELKKRCLVLQFCENINAGIQPLQNLRVLKYLESDLGFSEGMRNRWALHWIERNFQGLEKILKKTAGTYCFGDTLTVADAFLVPQVFASSRYQFGLDAFPNIRRVNAALCALPAFEQAHPSAQPDYLP